MCGLVGEEVTKVVEFEKGKEGKCWWENVATWWKQRQKDGLRRIRRIHRTKEWVLYNQIITTRIPRE